MPTLTHARTALVTLTGLVSPQVITAAIEFLIAFAAVIQQLVVWLMQIIAGILAPLFFLGWASNWQGVIKSRATDSVGVINGLPVGSDHDPLWEGPGAEAYRSKIDPQRTAISRVGTICDTIGSVMSAMGRAGVALYVTVLALIVTVSSTVQAVLAEIASVVGIPLVIPTGTAGLVTISALIALVSGLITYIVTLHSRAGEFESQLADNSVFTGSSGGGLVGGWPAAVTPASAGVLDDGTVTDGDVDWSVPRR